MYKLLEDFGLNFIVFMKRAQAGWDRTGWEAFRYMIYDGENGTILTRFLRKVQTKETSPSRTHLSWPKIRLFLIKVKTQIQLELPERPSLG